MSLSLETRAPLLNHLNLQGVCPMRRKLRKGQGECCCASFFIVTYYEYLRWKVLMFEARLEAAQCGN